MAGVAEELGVSTMTVSNAYNRPDQLSAGLRARIFEAAERLGYAGPDPVARSLRRQKTNLAGILYSNRLSYAFDDAAQVLFLKGVAAATEEAGMGLLLVPGTVGTSDEERAAAVTGRDRRRLRRLLGIRRRPLDPGRSQETAADGGRRPAHGGGRAVRRHRR